MPGSSVLRFIFSSGFEVDPERRFDLGRRARAARLREIYSIARKHHIFRGISPVGFREMLEDLGPSFVKIGQTLSSRSEILPKAYCQELEKLQSESLPLPFDEIRKALLDNYGEERFFEIFDSIDPTPLGSASLAQVHKAQLVSGETVAVKVQRPGVKVKMAQDIAIMRQFARRASTWVRGEQMLDFDDVVEEMWRTFLEETDFEREAQNLLDFGRLNKDCKYISCPTVYPQYCTEFVLVMEYIEGVPISDTARLRAGGYDLREIGEKLLDNYATQILDHGFFHADPHAGNIIIRDGKIVYIDLGIMGRLSPRDRTGFGDIISAVGVGSAARLKDALLAFAVVKDNSAIDHPRFLADLDLLLKDYGSVDVGDLDIGMFLSDVFALTRQSRVTLPTSITNVSRGIVTMEGTVAPFVGQDSIIGIINAHIKNSESEVDKAKETIEDAAKALYSAAVGMTEAASYAGDALHMLTRGQLKVNMEMVMPPKPLRDLSEMVSRVSMAIIIAGLFIGSSMLPYAADSAYVFGVPILSFFGYLGAFVLSVAVIINIMRKG